MALPGLASGQCDNACHASLHAASHRHAGSQNRPAGWCVIETLAACSDGEAAAEVGS